MLPFNLAMEKAHNEGGKKRILLGNGFSIGAHQQFNYGTLYEQAVSTGLPSHIEDLFSRYGTPNFEEVLRQLDEGQWLANHYLLKKSDQNLDMAEDYEKVKRLLVDSIAENHPEKPGLIPDQKLRAVSAFLQGFDDVFTTNYDLLLYWASLVGDSFLFEDGFGREIETDESYCVFLPTGSGGKAYLLSSRCTSPVHG